MLQVLRIQLQVVTVTLAIQTVIATAAESQTEPCSPPNWHWGPLLPERRTAFSCCGTGDAIVVLGGTFWTDLNTNEPKKEWLSAVYRLRQNGDHWEALPDFPSPIEYGLVVSWNERVYAIGGQNSAGMRAETYSISLGEPAPCWRSEPSLPRPLSRLRGGLWGSTIVAVTDEHKTTESEVVMAGPKVLALDAANTQSGWREITALPEASVGFRTAAIWFDKLYVFGGASETNQQRLLLSNKVWCYDLASDKWTACSDLPVPIRDATATKLGDRRIVLTGGVEEAVEASATPDQKSRILLSTRCLVYDCDNDRFTQVDPLPLAVADHGLAVLGGELFVVGGEDSPYRTRTDLVQRCNVDSMVQAVMREKKLQEKGTTGKSPLNDETGTKIPANAFPTQAKSLSSIPKFETKPLLTSSENY